MAGWLVAGSVLGSALALGLLLLVARRLSDRFGSDEPPLWRLLVWLAVALAGLVGLAFVRNEWLLGAGAVGITAWALVGAGLEARAGSARRRLVVLELYVVLFAATYLYARARGMVDGLRASTAASAALHEQLTAFALPLSELALSFSNAAQPAWSIGVLASALSRNLALWLALSSFACAVYAAAYLSRRPLPLPGAALFPYPRAAALAFVALALASELLPVNHPANLATLALCPLFVADGGALLFRWLSRFRARGFLLALLGAVALFSPVPLVLLEALGVVAQLSGLRELLPFVALDETPLRRPRLWSMLLVLGLGALCMAATTAVAARSLRRASPRLGVATEACGATEPSVDWAGRTATFEMPGARFSMDLDETPLAAAAPAEQCESAGKRLCTSDEWYLACACTYPLEVEAGTKSSTLYAFVARAERERQAGAPGPAEPTAAADKRSELRGLLTGRSEIVAPASGKGLLLAGPNDTLRDPWTVDCRHRAFLTPAGLGAMSGLAAVRCCR